MTVVMQPTQRNYEALGTDDRLVRGMGIFRKRNTRAS